jgi:hypothetical protein
LSFDRLTFGGLWQLPFVRLIFSTATNVLSICAHQQEIVQIDRRNINFFLQEMISFESNDLFENALSGKISNLQKSQKEILKKNWGDIHKKFLRTSYDHSLSRKCLFKVTRDFQASFE